MREITVPARVDCLGSIFDFVELEMCRAGIDNKLQNSIRTAVEEIFVNIASYAYPEGEGEVTVCLPEGQDAFVVEFLDSGVPFDPLSSEDPDTTISAEEREIGGLGIFMVKRMMGSVQYQRVDNKNVLTITNEISGGN